MWIFTLYGFFSVVADQRDPSCVQFRARDRTHLEALCDAFFALGGYPEIIATPHADYPFRIVLRQDIAAGIMECMTAEIVGGRVTNFKSAVAKARDEDPAYNGLLHEVWSIVRRHIDARRGPALRDFAPPAVLRMDWRFPLDPDEANSAALDDLQREIGSELIKRVR